MTATRAAVGQTLNVSLWVDCVAKLSLRLRLNRDSVDQDYDSRGTVDDGSAGSRARSILLFV